MKSRNATCQFEIKFTLTFLLILHGLKIICCTIPSRRKHKYRKNYWL